MSLVVADTSAIIAAYDRAAADHERAQELLAVSVTVVSPLVLDEVDHLLLARFGKERRVADLVLNDLLESIDDDRMVLASLDRHDLRAAQDVIRRYAGLRLDLADATSVVLAHRYLTNEVLTLDVKDFRAVTPLTPGMAAFRLPLQD
jgi:predicted nucleic acid-binding protein